jgi:PBSX family phage terminase large subunit
MSALATTSVLPPKILPFGIRAKRFITRPPQQDARINILVGSVRSAKAQPLDAKVLTPSGWRRMGDLQVGDMVIAGDGSPTMVTGVFPQGKKEIFRVGFKDGSSTECCAEHLWQTSTYYERSNFGRHPNRKCSQPKVRTTEDIRKTLRSPHLNALNHTIRTVGPVQFEARSVPIDPYVLGVLLGDGCFRQKRGIGFSSEDREIVEYLSTHIPGCEVRHQSKYDYSIVWTGRSNICARGHEISGDNAVHHKNSRDSCRTCANLNQSARYYRTTTRKPIKRRFEKECAAVPPIRHPVRNYLKTSGLLRAFSHEKFVPEEYLFNTIEVRLELLRGLMDTDGSAYSKGGGAHFGTTSVRLRDGVKFLVQSLGGTVSESASVPTFTYEGVKKNGRIAYSLSLCLPPGIVPFKLERKRKAFKERTRYKPTRYIVSVDSLGQKEAQCIRVAHPSHLYVTDDFIVTHNTWALSAKLVIHLCRYKVNGLRILTGVSKDQVYKNVLVDLFEVVGEKNYDYNKQSGELRLYDSHWHVVGAHDEGSVKFIQGNTIGIALCDELLLMPKTFFDMLISRMSSWGARLYASTNSGSPWHWLKTDVLDSKDLTHGLGKDIWWQTWTMDDNPSLDQRFIEFTKRKYTGVFYSRFILGLWVLAEGAVYRDCLTEENYYTDATRPAALLSQHGHVEHVVALDYGTDLPLAAIDIYDDGDTVWFDREYYYSSREQGRQKTDKEYADDLINGWGAHWVGFGNNERLWPSVIIDPSAASFRAELRSRGVLVIDADNEVLDGIRRVSTMLSRKKIRINKDHCPKGIQEMVAYAWPDESKLDKKEEKPIKKRDHYPDSARYFVKTRIPDYRIASL